MKSFSELNINHDTFKNEKPPVQRLAAKAARKDYTMKSVIREDEAAVSPVIATILMVAITVVLAAVLYVMVSEIGRAAGRDRLWVAVSAVERKLGNATSGVA